MNVQWVRIVDGVAVGVYTSDEAMTEIVTDWASESLDVPPMPE